MTAARFTRRSLLRRSAQGAALLAGGALAAPALIGRASAAPLKLNLRDTGANERPPPADWSRSFRRNCRAAP